MFRGSSGGENQGPWVPLVPGCRGSVSGPSKASGLDPSAKARIQRERIINIQPGAHNGPQRLRNSEVCSFPEHNRPIRRVSLLFCPLYRCYITLMYHHIRRRSHARIVYFFCASSLLPDSANSNPASCPSPLFYFCPFSPGQLLSSPFSTSPDPSCFPANRLPRCPWVSAVSDLRPPSSLAQT